MTNEPGEDKGTLSVVESAAAVAVARALDSPEAHRRHLRVILLSCCISVTVVALIALPTVLLLDSERRSAALERARFNCQQHSATVRILEEDLEGDVKLREESRRLAQQPAIRDRFAALFGREVVENYYTKLAELEQARTTNWRTNLLPRLRDLSRTDCKAVLDAGGVKTTPTEPSRTATTAPSRMTTTRTKTTK